METISYYLFWGGLSSAFIAAICYCSLNPVLAPATAAESPRPTTGFVRKTGPRTGSFMASASLLLLGLALVSRTVAAERPPYGTMWEYLLAFSTAALAAYLVYEVTSGKRGLGAIVIPLITVTLLVSAFAFPHELKPLVPALNNNALLAIHVATMIVAYGLLSVSFGAAVAYFIQERRPVSWLPSRPEAEELVARFISFGFPLLGLGIALGAYWASFAWGRYWGWDPKETTALVSWLTYAGYMHARSIPRFSGKPATLISIVGFLFIVFNVFIVNFVISGLHSYAS